MVTSLDRIDNLFLFHYFEATAEAFETGQEPANVITLLLVSVAAFGLAVLFFQRRNLTVGAWPWQRGKVPVSQSG